LSSRYLKWSRENFKLNGIDCGEGSAHRFFAWDAFEFLERAVRRGERYDLVINDPPTFSRNKKGKVFRVQDDYGTLVENGVRVLAEDGILHTSTNYGGFDRRKLDEIVRRAVVRAGRSVKSLEYPDMPCDFTGDPYLIACRLAV